MTETPAFLPPDLISLRDLAEEIELGDLGRLLAAGSVRAFYYHDANGFCAIPHQIWLGPTGKEIFESGQISAVIASQQLGTWTGGNDLSVFICSADLQPYIDDPPGISSSEHPRSVDNEGKNKGGRPAADWDAVFIAAACIAVTEGLPTTQAAFIDAIQTRLGDGAPSDTQMKTRIGPFFRELKKALSQSET